MTALKSRSSRPPLGRGTMSTSFPRMDLRNGNMFATLNQSLAISSRLSCGSKSTSTSATRQCSSWRSRSTETGIFVPPSTSLKMYRIRRRRSSACRSRTSTLQRLSGLHKVSEWKQTCKRGANELIHKGAPAGSVTPETVLTSRRWCEIRVVCRRRDNWIRRCVCNLYPGAPQSLASLPEQPCVYVEPVDRILDDHGLQPCDKSDPGLVHTGQATRLGSVETEAREDYVFSFRYRSKAQLLDLPQHLDRQWILDGPFESSSHDSLPVNNNDGPLHSQGTHAHCQLSVDWKLSDTLSGVDAQDGQDRRPYHAGPCTPPIAADDAALVGTESDTPRRKRRSSCPLPEDHQMHRRTKRRKRGY
ncbi:uncharacterized protein BKA78DRAFT_131274 [Phyllosticta capitalensis]|uniref:uncharacterized protein n=1 Tax=Phyllosticta capitalensis TaxID=121624 RepID=UPI0031326D7D